MITVKYSHKGGTHTLELSGHAGSAPIGQDLVCAGVSTLAYTITQMIEDLSPVMEEPSRIEMSPGHTLVECHPKRGEAEAIDIVFATVLCGFHLLSEQYPEHVQMEG